MPNDQEDRRNQGTIVIEEERLRERFTQIPNTILRRPDVTPGAKLTYVVLLSYAWQEDSCFPGQDVLARDTGVSRRSVVTYLQELQEKGLLAVKRRGLGRTNIYTLTRWDTSGSANFAHQEVKNLTSPEVQILHANNTQGKNTHSKKTQISNSFDRNTLHKTGIETTFEENRIAKTRRNGSQDYEQPTRSPRSGPTVVAQILEQRRGDRHVEGPSEPPGRDSRPVSVESGPESQLPRRRGRPPKATEQITALVQLFSDELHDTEHVPSNTGQAARLWKASGLPEDAFCQRMYEARSRAKQAGNIEKPANGEAGRYGLRNRMPYFFACLRDLLGMSEEGSGRQTASPS